MINDVGQGQGHMVINVVTISFPDVILNLVDIMSEKQIKKDKRQVQGVSQSQAAALRRQQEAEKADKTKQAQIKQTYEQH